MKSFDNKNGIALCGVGEFSDPVGLLSIGVSIFFVVISFYYIPRRVFKNEALSKKQKWESVFFLAVSWIFLGLMLFALAYSGSPLLVLFFLPHFFYVAKYGGIKLALILYLSILIVGGLSLSRLMYSTCTTF